MTDVTDRENPQAL